MKTRIFKVAGIALLLIACFVLATPYIFKGKITRLVKARINKDLRAHVNFSNVNISLFRQFPDIAIGLDNLQVVCVGEFQGDTLLTTQRLDIACNIRSIIAGDSIRIYSLTANQPRFHGLIHKNGHANWNIVKPAAYPGNATGSSTLVIRPGIQCYAMHSGYVDFLDERKDMHVEVFNLEQTGRGNFGSEQFILQTKTTADAVHLDIGGAIPFRIAAKTNISVAFRVNNKTHTYSFNTDRVAFNDLKLHTEGFFQWVNDSSYNMNIRFKVPSTNFKDFLSMLPSIYGKDFASIETNGHINFNGFIKGRYDDKHLPAYHANLYVSDAYFKYPDLSVPAENINLACQLDNPDGHPNHLTVNISRAHAEMNKDTLDLHLLAKNLETKPFIDFAFVAKLDLANIPKWMKLASGTRLSGLLNANVHARGIIPGTEKQKKDLFQSNGSFSLAGFTYFSKAYPGGMTLDELLLNFNPKNVLIQELKGAYLSTHIDATGAINNLFDFALRDKPLNASIDLKADELDLREWISKLGNTSSTPANGLFEVPGNIDLSINAEAGRMHYDNLDLQNVSGRFLISDETVQLQNVKASGLDGNLVIDGSYSTSEHGASPEIAFNYDVKGLDIQKTFFAFNTVRKLMPVAKYMAGNLDAHMSLNGRLHDDMTPDLQTLQGEGTVSLPAATLKDFGPLDKLAQSLDIAELKDVPLKDVKAGFSFKSGRVVVAPFLVQANKMDMQIAGTHGFDQSLDYDIRMQVPRSQLGNKGSMFVKNVVVQAADQGIPIRLDDAVTMNIRMNGTLTSPEVKADMDATVDNAAIDLKKEVNAFINAKLDSAKQQLRNPQAAGKKRVSMQTGNKSKPDVKRKKNTRTTKKTHVHAKTKKHTVHPKAKKKKKKSSGNYTMNMKKDKRTAGSSGNRG
jgi:hypothetical protein